MKVAVLADDVQWRELLSISENVEWIRCLDETKFAEDDIAIGIDLSEDAFTKNYAAIKKTILINSVTVALKEINAAENIIRINGWNGFLARQVWEISGVINNSAEIFFSEIQRVVTIVPDEPGLISARIISMIINEAYFALDERLSTRNEIDIAMKLGTNYPYGPFEWCNKIGIKKIYSLLKKLSGADERYLPSPLLVKEAMI